MSQNDDKARKLAMHNPMNSALIGVNAAVISGIFIFFAISSQSVASNLFSIDSTRCSYGFDISPEQGQMSVAVSGGFLIIPFAISSMLILLRSDYYARLASVIGFGLMVVAALMVLTAISCRLPIGFLTFVIILPASVTAFVLFMIHHQRGKRPL
jgi:hypothetical protein